MSIDTESHAHELARYQCFIFYEIYQTHHQPRISHQPIAKERYWRDASIIDCREDKTGLTTDASPLLAEDADTATT